MRNIEFNELKLKNINNEEAFYQSYLRTLPQKIDADNISSIPEKQYEIFYLNILGGKIILLNTKYINSKNTQNQELFYDYSIALKIYNLMLDIYDSIEAEKEEINELYKDERLHKNYEIEELKKQDDILFHNKQKEFTTQNSTNLVQKITNKLKKN